jgi:uncharacterized protein
VPHPNVVLFDVRVGKLTCSGDTSTRPIEKIPAQAELGRGTLGSKDEGHSLGHPAQQFLRLLGRLAEFVPIVYPVRACRDPKDDKFLEVALNGKAAVILSGDSDLLALHPWQGIPILSPAEYLKR